MDMKYGLRATAWDDEPDSEEMILKTLRGFQYVNKAPLHTVILWVHPSQTHVVTKVLETTGYQHIQMLTWYKFDQQLAGPVFRMTSATEVALVAYWGNAKQDARGMFNMPTNPTSRHNVVLGPGKRVLSKNSLGLAICSREAGLPVRVYHQLVSQHGCLDHGSWFRSRR